MTRITFLLCVFFACVIAARLLVEQAQKRHLSTTCARDTPDLPNRRAELLALEALRGRFKRSPPCGHLSHEVV